MIMAVSEVSSGARSEPTSAGPKIDRPKSRQPILDWGTMDKYTEVRNFRLEVNNKLQLHMYIIQKK